ncbi:MAG TPA: septation protein SepH [Pseudonocardiaceae bacterium]
MRALRVVGLSEDGETVICEDLTRNERFTIPADERLRAAARGDITRLGQIAIELESQMRPREIQTRIRAGESIDQIAAASGLPVNKVERFAYPVLLERSRTAELAQRAHPVREDGPDVQTLAEVAAHAFGLRGHDYSTVTWDSWRGEDGKWIVQLAWQTGRSENHAHWAFHPGAHGGTVSPLDDHALDLMDPNAPVRPLRTVRPVTELARQAMDVAPAPVRPVEVEPEIEEPVAPPVRASRVVEPEPLPEPEPEPEPVVVKPAMPKPAVAKPAVAKPAVAKPTVSKPVAKPAATKPAATVEPEPVVEEPEPEQALVPEPEREQPAARKPEPPKRGKKNHPIVPSWEDVLLGVRGQRG